MGGARDRSGYWKNLEKVLESPQSSKFQQAKGGHGALGAKSRDGCTTCPPLWLHTLQHPTGPVRSPGNNVPMCRLSNQSQLMVSLMFEGLVTQSSQGALNVHLSALLLMPLSSSFSCPCGWSGPGDRSGQCSRAEW